MTTSTNNLNIMNWGDVSATNGYVFGDCSKRIRTYKKEVFFTSTVTTESIDYLIDAIQKVISANETDSNGYANMHNKEDKSEPTRIYLHLDSTGGNLSATFKFIDYIDAMKSCNRLYLVIIGTGLLASAATIMACCANEFYITNHTEVLIHELSSCLWGKLSFMTSHYNACVKIHQNMINMYKRRNLTVSDEELTDILSKESIFNAEDYVNMGFADGIFGINTHKHKDKKRKKMMD